MSTQTTGAAELPEALLRLADELESEFWADSRVCKLVDAVRRLHAENEALRAQPAGAATPAAPAPGVPDGWNLVPKESTAAMQWAFSRAETRYRDGVGRSHPMDNASAFKSQYAAMLAAAPQPPTAAQEPIDMVLHCPKCGLQHIDAPEEVPGMPILKSAATPEHPHRMVQVGTYTGQGEWKNPPHRSHLCHGCGHIWRPADVPTNGVQVVKTKDKADSPIATPQPAVTAGAVDALDAARYRWLREQHEGDDAEETCCVFAPNDMRECLVPVGSLRGELDEFIDAALAAQHATHQEDHK